MIIITHDMQVTLNEQQMTSHYEKCIRNTLEISTLIRECGADKICYVIKEDTNSNLADFLTKYLAPNKRKYLQEPIMVNAKVKGLMKN